MTIILYLPARRSARGAATKGPINAIKGATPETITASSLDRPKAFICKGMKGNRAPMAVKLMMVIRIS